MSAGPAHTAQEGERVQDNQGGLGHNVQSHHAPRDGFDQGEHGAGTGVAGGHGTAHSGNTQAGGNDSFNGGLGGEHASAGLPKHTPTPIADKFTSQSGGANDGGSGTLDAYSGGKTGSTGTGHGAGYAAGAGAIAGGAVTGAYVGSGTKNALTGQSGAHTTGQGVGYGGENLDSTTAASTAAFSSTGTGVGPSGGAGGHYSTPHQSSTIGSTGGAGIGAGAIVGAGLTGGADAGATSKITDNLGAGATGAGAAGAGVGAAAASGGKATGHFGTVDDHPRGEPISDPKEIDTGGPHSLVYHDGKYVHRRDLEGQGSTGV